MNDQRLADNVSTIIQHARKLNELLRDNRIRELEIVLGTIHRASEISIYRCMDIQFPAKAYAPQETHP